MSQLREELRSEMNVSVEMIEFKRKDLLKKLVGELSHERL